MVAKQWIQEFLEGPLWNNQKPLPAIYICVYIYSDTYIDPSTAPKQTTDLLSHTRRGVKRKKAPIGDGKHSDPHIDGSSKYTYTYVYI